MNRPRFMMPGRLVRGPGTLLACVCASAAACIHTASRHPTIGIQAAPPGAFDVIPQALKILVTDGIVMGIMLAMLLNIVLPREAERPTASAH